MSAINYNLNIEKGSSYEIEFNYLDSNNRGIDLSNWCVIMQMLDNQNALYTFSNREFNSQYRLSTSSDGVISLQLSSTFTNSLNFDSANYDIDVQEPHEQYQGSGLKTYRIAYGSVSITQRSTSLVLNNCNIIPENPECSSLCLNNDIYSKQYIGSGLLIADITENLSAPIFIPDTNNIENLSVSINGLNHPSPQDLVFILSPPSGNQVLLSAHQKINNYKNNFTFTISDDINISTILNNVVHNGICKIVDKTSYINYDTVLTHNFSHLKSTSPSGNWYLNILDRDIGGSGSVSSWRINILYEYEES